MLLIKLRKFPSVPSFLRIFIVKRASLVAQTVKNLPVMWETQGQSLSREDPLKKEMATHSSILAWIIPWTEESGGHKRVFVVV